MVQFSMSHTLNCDYLSIKHELMHIIAPVLQNVTITVHYSKYSKKVNNKICILCQIALQYGDQLSLLKLSSVYLAAGPLFSRMKKVIKTQIVNIVNILNTSSGQCVHPLI